MGNKLVEYFKGVKKTSLILCHYDTEFGGYKVHGVVSDSGRHSNITIPNTYIARNYGELPIVSVESFGFEKTKRLKTVSLPDSIVVIGLAAFDGCKNLKTINTPKGLKRIGGIAFRGCKSLDLQLHNEIEYIAESAFENTNDIMQERYKQWKEFNQFKKFVSGNDTVDLKKQK